ncbi:hypothetical protein [Pseudoneobacillus sp. C159]
MMGQKRQSVLVENTLHELFYKRQKTKPVKVIACLSYHFVGMEQALQILKNLRQQNIIIRLFIEEEVFRYFSRREILARTEIDDWISFRALEKMEDWDFLFLPTLNFSLASNIISLNDQDRFVRFLIHSLFSHKKVTALSTGLNPNHPVWDGQQLTHGTPFIKTKLKNNLRDLQAVGIHLLEPDDIKNFFTAKSSPKKSVMTAKDLDFFLSRKETELIIDQQTIVTPLAKDILKQHQINLIRK